MATKNANKILVIDDDNNILDFLIELLQDEISVSFSSEGPKALEIAKLHKPDLILLDVMMPDMNGFEVCKRLKADPETQHIPVIFLTGKTDGKDVVEGLELGAVDYITKPFDPEIVITKVQNILKQITATRAATAPKESEVAAPASSQDRRALGAERDDRYQKPAEKAQGMSLTQFLIIALLIAGGGGGGYAWYTNTSADNNNGGADTVERTAPAEPAPTADKVEKSDGSASKAPLNGTTATLTDSCGDIPKVPWWGNPSHGSIIAYVNNKAEGDWNAYIAKWERQLTKLQGILSKDGTAIAPKVGTRLKGPVLAEYIAQVEGRIEVTRCLADILANR